MLVYWLLFAFFAIGALLTRQAGAQGKTSIILLLGAVAVGLAIGLRYQVGADWRTYEFLYSYAGHASLTRLLRFGDPGYQFVSWGLQRIGADFWVLNLFAA